ncbi:hypothetical protein PF005_g16883 [Phytophthora fragariae]|uniref:Uncharacterized protein n=1 Tax=Phytophthora fragariae TaxID=53985 RepID=A0A6A3EHW6_9STRA|nr:hypothetical protein PF009_g17917 [Phytophthora fragariae]KAE8995061.1 hypothetical protein PF011_g16488 [Phytophthora fragariae]KAE9095988.1 hypothetical protein PF010_g16502 [Phytophthora fragariae]KAE9096165.1 hypothetical protein PF007_g17105 [Phytophthora fragariae]KAE9129597.1 hypothetical protein PF006_g15970 [Phytophthora fragariae]
MRQLLGNVCLVPLVALSPAWLDIFTGVLRRLRQKQSATGQSMVLGHREPFLVIPLGRRHCSR